MSMNTELNTELMKKNRPPDALGIIPAGHYKSKNCGFGVRIKEPC